MPEVIPAGIVEVMETGTRGANLLLAQGYMLLHLADHAEARIMQRSDGTPQPFVQRYMTFVLGRPAYIKHVDLPRFEPRARDTADAPIQRGRGRRAHHHRMSTTRSALHRLAWASLDAVRHQYECGECHAEPIITLDENHDPVLTCRTHGAENVVLR